MPYYIGDLNRDPTLENYPHEDLASGMGAARSNGLV